MDSVRVMGLVRVMRGGSIVPMEPSARRVRMDSS
jgi:hypothetical protein